MSIKVSSWVWEHSEQKGTALLVMLAIADHAHDDGAGAYPSVATLARKARTTPRNVKMLLRRLQDDGELEILFNAGPNRVNVYRVKKFHPYAPEGEENSPEGEIQRQQGVKAPSPKPSVRTVKEPSTVVEAIPDDITTRCLQLLLQVKGFPRDQGENALKLAEYRSDFPAVDPVEVCKDFKAYSDETSKPPSRLRLRNFFKQASKQAGRNGQSNGRGKSIAVIGATEADYAESEYRFHA